MLFFKDNLKAIKKIIKTVNIPVQVGGGIRDEKTIKILLDAGVSGIVLGTIALENKALLAQLLKKYGGQIIIALDTKNGKLVKRGWLEKTNKSYLQAASEFEKQGVKKFMYTDTVKDGTLTKPNYKEIIKLKKTLSVPVFVGGGVTNINDIKKLKAIGIKGMIIGTG